MIPQSLTIEALSPEVIKQEVNNLFDDFFKQRIADADAMSLQYGRLWRILASLNKAGGKRYRPYMVVLAYSCYGGRERANIIQVAMAWELLHLCMLIHDDIIDNDLRRYGVLNIAGSYREIYKQTNATADRQAHLADAAALLAGDIALSTAHELVLTANVDSTTKLQVHRCLTQAVSTVAGGELLDSEASLYSMMEADPLLIAQTKTASYTFIGPLVTGAILAGASNSDADDMEKLGNALGCAYQLQDDVLGIFGDPAVTGKSNVSDLMEGKRTYLMQQTFRRAGSSDLAVLERLVGKADLTTVEADQIRTIIIRSGAKQQTEGLIGQYAAQAQAIVTGLQIADENRHLLLNLIQTTTVRVS